MRVYCLRTPCVSLLLLPISRHSIPYSPLFILLHLPSLSITVVPEAAPPILFVRQNPAGVILNKIQFGLVFQLCDSDNSRIAFLYGTA